MASSTLYPPLVNSYEPAFIAGSSSSLRVYFSLSRLSNIPAGTELTVHAQIYRQDGVKVLNTNNDIVNKRYRATGIILNLVPTKSETEDNLYYITINNSDLKSLVTLSGTTFAGWIPGWTYKIQLRLSTVAYNPALYPRQEAWLQEFSNSFSEWSTICYTKAISPMVLKIPIFNYDDGDLTSHYNENTIYTISEMDLFGTLESKIAEANEDFEYVRFTLYLGEDLLEDTGEIYKMEQSNTYFSYSFKTNLREDAQYTLYVTYKTENEYTLPAPIKFNFMIENLATEIINAQLVTVDADSQGLLTSITSLDEEEDEGRIALKIYSPSTEPWSGNICIRRASQEDNFQTWEDIKIFTVKEENLNSLDVIYDYTIQSGVWYKYGIQSIDKDGTRGVAVEITRPIQRLFTYSFILGQDNQQLKLQFDNTMSSFKHQIYDSKKDTIGSQFPFISRNAAVNYRTFPIGALISFQMDENNTFLHNGKKDVYKYTDVVNLYDNYTVENGRQIYDYTYERDFRKLVLDFLQDGKPKLFKSPTEGNIIVRLMDINCTPNQSLDRMIYSLTANAHEIDENTMTNYLKYGFYNPGSYSASLAAVTYHIGQVDGSFSANDNVFKKIYEKYDSQGRNYGGYRRKLVRIERVCITINGYYYLPDGALEPQFMPGHQLRIYNNQGALVLGNNMLLNYSGGSGEQLITIYDPRGMYEFDSLLKFYYTGNPLTNDSLYLLGDAEGLVTAVDATIDFVYGLSTEVYSAHEIQERTPIRGIGQFYEEVAPGESIYNTIYYQHYIESSSTFRRLSTISSIEIEANPHTVFGIRDGVEAEMQYHEVGDTGVLRLYELSNITAIQYIGKRYLKTPYDDATLSEEIVTEDVLDDKNHYILNASTDVSVTYYYVDMQGTYKAEV